MTLSVPTMPINPTGVNNTSSLSTGLQFLFLPGKSLSNLVVPSQVGVATGTSVTSESFGASRLFANGEKITMANNANVGANMVSTGSITLAALINMTTSSVARGIVSKTPSNGLAAPYDFYVNSSSGTVNMVLGNGSTVEYYEGNAPIPLSQWVMVVAYANDVGGTTGNTYASFFNDGSYNVFRNPSGANPAMSTGTDAMIIGARVDGGTQMIGKIAAVWGWNRTLTDPEIGTLAGSTMWEMINETAAITSTVNQSMNVGIY